MNNSGFRARSQPIVRWENVVPVMATASKHLLQQYESKAYNLGYNPKQQWIYICMYILSYHITSHYIRLYYLKQYLSFYNNCHNIVTLYYIICNKIHISYGIIWVLRSLCHYCTMTSKMIIDITAQKPTAGREQKTRRFVSSDQWHQMVPRPQRSEDHLQKTMEEKKHGYQRVNVRYNNSM